MAAAKQAVSVDQILAVDDVARVGEWLDVPEWGEGAGVRLRGLTRGEVKLMGDETLSIDDREANALALALVDPAVSVDQAKRILADKGFAATERIMSKVLELSGLTPGFRT